MKTRRQKILEDRQSISRRDSRSPSLVNGGGNSELIPIDLIIEILSRLPAKFIARCRYVSKLWASIILRPDFTDLVLTRSATTRPHLLFACEKDGLKEIRILKGRTETLLVICNPSTGQSLTLPRVKTRRVDVKSFFGYDPIDKQFKFLSMSISKYGRNKVSEEHQILTLGNGKLSWRMIECSIPHYPLFDGICISGVLYYSAMVKGFEAKCRIACFDLRSEKFKLIEIEDNSVRLRLVNYKNKLATLRSFDGCSSFQLCVLEDAEKHEWSTHTYVLPTLSPDVVPSVGIYVRGVTRTGEIVLSPYYPYNSFYLIYYNLDRNTATKVDIQGIDVSELNEIHTFMDHVEDVKLGGVFKTS